MGRAAQCPDPSRRSGACVPIPLLRGRAGWSGEWAGPVVARAHRHLPPAAHPPQALELDSIHSHHWCIQGCSAVTGENLLPGIDWLLDDISSRIFTAD